MIWKIAKKEFLLDLMTFKFAVGTIVCVPFRLPLFCDQFSSTFALRTNRWVVPTETC